MLAAFGGKRCAFGVRELRDDVDQLRPRTLQRRFDLIGAHAVIIAFNRHEARFKAAEGLQSGEVAGILDDHFITGIDKDFGDQINRLLRAGSDEHAVSIRIDPAFGDAVSDPLAQRAHAFGRAVLHGLRPFFGEDFFVSLGDGVDGKEFRRGHATGERDDFRLPGDFQNLADLRCVHVGHAARKAVSRRDSFLRLSNQERSAFVSS